MQMQNNSQSDPKVRDVERDKVDDNKKSLYLVDNNQTRREKCKRVRKEREERIQEACPTCRTSTWTAHLLSTKGG
jgi:hypothetical protein